MDQEEVRQINKFSDHTCTDCLQKFPTSNRLCRKTPRMAMYRSDSLIAKVAMKQMMQSILPKRHPKIQTYWTRNLKYKATHSGHKKSLNRWQHNFSHLRIEAKEQIQAASRRIKKRFNERNIPYDEWKRRNKEAIHAPLSIVRERILELHSSSEQFFQLDFWLRSERVAKQ